MQMESVSILPRIAVTEIRAPQTRVTLLTEIVQTYRYHAMTIIPVLPMGAATGSAQTLL